MHLEGDVAKSALNVTRKKEKRKKKTFARVIAAQINFGVAVVTETCLRR